MSEQQRFGATVGPGGQLVPDARTVWAASLAKLVGKRVTVTVQPEAQRRSSQANRRYWACIVPLAQEIWSQGRAVPYTREETHEVLVQVLCGYEDGPLPGSRVRVRTSEMDTSTFGAYVRSCEALLWDQYQCRVPDGDWSAVEV